MCLVRLINYKSIVFHPENGDYSAAHKTYTLTRATQTRKQCPDAWLRELDGVLINHC